MWYNIKLKVREEGCFAAPTKKAIARANRRSNLVIGEFRADRPFLFIIANYGAENGPIELIGRVLEPKQSELVEISETFEKEQGKPIYLKQSPGTFTIYAICFRSFAGS